MNIALIDLNHMTVGVHTNTVPLGIGLIANYLKNTIKYEFDIRIFKDPMKLCNVLKRWKPDVLGITQYLWNSELNLYMAQIVKKNNPDCLVVAGGPNLYLSSEEKPKYLKKYNFVDLCISFDGEIPFAQVIKRIINDETIDDIKKCPVAGSYAFDNLNDRLVESKAPLPRIHSLDVFGSIYAEGFFNELLNEGFHPFLQTHRGCPFQCTYCHTGDDYYSSVIFQSVKYFKDDMEYLGSRFRGKHNIILYLADTNFGLFNQDFEIAYVIRQVQDKYDWPKDINVNSGNNPHKLLELLSILKYKFTPSVSLQTLTPKVLTNIKRRNIPFNEFVNFQNEVTQNIKENTATELILSLPEETKESFLATVSLVLNSGVQNIVIYTLMSLRGTSIASPETTNSYGQIIRYRLVPRCFSEIDGVKIFEIEEVVVSTNSMSFEDYMDLRGLALIIAIFSSSIEIYPIRKFLAEHKLDIADWIFGIQNIISDFHNLNSLYKSFLQETKDELFITPESLIEFFNCKKNYDLLYNGKLGDNLLRKYKTIALSEHYQECLEVALKEARKLASQSIDFKLLDTIISDLELYLRTRDIGHIYKTGYSKRVLGSATLHYNIPRWLAGEQDSAPIENYKGSFSYSIVVTDYIRNRLKDFILLNRNLELSLQILYRDGYTKDFWPEWVYRKSP